MANRRQITSDPFQVELAAAYAVLNHFDARLGELLQLYYTAVNSTTQLTAMRRVRRLRRALRRAAH